MSANAQTGARWLSLDVEADGPIPGPFSMVSFALVDVIDPTRFFYAEVCPISDAWIPGALAVSGFDRVATLKFPKAQTVMADLEAWCLKEYPNQRLTIFSDNPAFDCQFLNFYSQTYLGKLLFGHSARRIGDVWAGHMGNIRDQSGWKKLRTASHSHHALDDALGNAGALCKIAQMIKASPHKNSTSPNKPAKK